LVVDCPPLPQPVFVDRDMWEKIVLNLLSNAFKFTFEGEIAVSLAAASPDGVELQVRDTGEGIPQDEMPRLFERFHRVQNARGRTHEGSGIGLALVQELVRLHGGTIRVTSAVGRGTTIEYIESYCAADDGFEFFGGTVNTKYLVSAFNDDDAFDTDMGYRGTNQFWFAIQAPDKRNYGMELNNQVNEQPQVTQRTPASAFSGP